MWGKERRHRREEDAPVLYVGEHRALEAGEKRVIARRSEEESTGWGPFKRRQYEVVLRTGTGNPELPQVEQILFTDYFRNGNVAKKAGVKRIEKLNKLLRRDI